MSDESLWHQLLSHRFVCSLQKLLAFKLTIAFEKKQFNSCLPDIQSPLGKQQSESPQADQLAEEEDSSSESSNADDSTCSNPSSTDLESIDANPDHWLSIFNSCQEENEFFKILTLRGKLKKASIGRLGSGMNSWFIPAEILTELIIIQAIKNEIKNQFSEWEIAKALTYGVLHVVVIQVVNKSNSGLGASLVSLEALFWSLWAPFFAKVCIIIVTNCTEVAPHAMLGPLSDRTVPEPTQA